MKDVMLLAGAGQIGMAIARRMGHGMKIIIGYKKPENVQTISEAQKYGEISMLFNAAGVSPS